MGHVTQGTPTAVVALTAAVVAGLLGGCTGTAAPQPPPASSTSPAGPTGSSAVASAATSDATSGSVRSDDRLALALLAVEDLPTGFTQEPANPTQGQVSSKDPACAPFLAFINARQMAGSVAHAGSRYAGGQLGPFIDQQIDALASSAAVATEQAQLRTAVSQCPGATVTLVGQTSSPMVIEPVTAPNVGDNPVAFRLTVDLGGGSSVAAFSFTQVYAGVKDTVVTLSFVAADPAQVEELTRVAVDRATTVLG